MKTHNNFRGTVLLTTVITTLMLSACGGSSGSSGSSSLSTNQQNYESFALAQNGGQHYPVAKLIIGTTSTGAPSADTTQSYFYTANSSLPVSPGLANSVTLTTSDSSLDAHLAVPAITPQRYLVNGAVAVGESVAVHYTGGNVEENVIATDGSTVLQTLLGTSYTTVPLTGEISQSPAELLGGSEVGIFTNTFDNTTLYNTSATWSTGAAYMKVTRNFVNDTVLVDDCNTPDTTGVNVTACTSSATQLTSFFPHASATDGKTYNLTDGQIVTLAGTTAWVSNTSISDPTARYRVYYQNNGQIYSGSLIRAGTPLAWAMPYSMQSQSFYIFLNNAAVQSISAALTF